MAKRWAKSFYNSKEWKRMRDYIITRDHGLCTRCKKPGFIVHHIKELTPTNMHDPRITLNPKNLTYLCKDCHDDIHGVGKQAERPYRITATGDIVPK